MTEILNPAQRRARELAAQLERAALRALRQLPDSSPGLRARIVASAGVRVLVFPEEAVAINADRATTLSWALAADAARVCTHTTAELGQTMAALTAAQDALGAGLREDASKLSAIGGLRRIFKARDVRAAITGHLDRTLRLFESLPVRPADFDEVLAAVAAASGIAVVPGGYRLVDRAGKASGITVTDSELGVGRTIKDLRASSLKAAEAYEDRVERILALLSHGGEDLSGEDSAAEAKTVAGDARMTDNPTPTVDEVHEYRRKVSSQKPPALVRAAADPTAKTRRARQDASQLTPIHAEEAARIMRASVTDDEWAEIWAPLRALQSALAIDFIERHLTRAYGRPPVSFEDWARLRWVRGLRNSDQLCESYLKQLRPRSARPVIQLFRSWVERKWVEHRAQPANTTFGRPLDRASWEAQTIAGRTEKRRTTRLQGATFAAETAMDDRTPEDGTEFQ